MGEVSNTLKPLLKEIQKLDPLVTIFGLMEKIKLLKSSKDKTEPSLRSQKEASSNISV